MTLRVSGEGFILYFYNEMHVNDTILHTVQIALTYAPHKNSIFNTTAVFVQGHNLQTLVQSVNTIVI